MRAESAAKVLLVGDYPPPTGGIAVHVQQLHDFLRRRGVQARVLDIGKGGQRAPEVVPVRSAADLARHVAWHAARGWWIHLHTNGANAKSWMVAGAVASLVWPFRHRSLVTLHSGLLPGFLAAGPARRAAARAALAGFGQVIAVSRPVANALRLAGLAGEKIVTHPAFLASEVRPGRPPAELWAARQRRTPLLAYCHHPSPVYGRGTAFEAVQRLSGEHPRVGLAVMGPGTTDPDFWRDACAAGVEDRLEVFGELDHACALAVMAASDAFLRPTLADGDSVSVREALALGIRCLASDAAERPAGVTVFRMGDAKDLARKVGEVLMQAPKAAPEPDAGEWLLRRYRPPAVQGAPGGEYAEA